MKKILLTILASVISLCANSTYFKHIGIKEGLAQLSVVSIHQDEFGRMWFGTNEGLSVYDGEKIVTYKSINHPDSPSGSTSPAVNLDGQIHCIVSDRNNDLYFRADYDLIKYDIRKRRFSTLQTNRVNALAGIDGVIWFAHADSVFTLDTHGAEQTFILRVDGVKTINEIHKTKDSTLWIGTTTGLYHIDKEGKTSCIIARKDISKIYEASNGDLWIGCRMESMYRIERNGKITGYRHDPNNPHSIASDQVRTFIEGENGEIWIGTFKGLQKLDTETNRYTCYTQSKLPGGLAHSSIFALYKDRQGTIWIGTYYGGVNYFNPYGDIFTYYADDPDRDDCLSYGFIGNMVEDRDHNIWICTEGGGLNKLNRHTGKIQHFYASRHTNSVAHNNLKSICYDEKRHTLYLGTHTGGLSRYDINRNYFTNYLERYPSATHRPNDVVHHVRIYKDSLVVMARNGLFVMDLQTEEMKPMFPTLSPTLTNGLSFYIDSRDYIWIIKVSSVLRININRPEESEIYFRKNFQTTVVTETASGDIFIGSRGAGLFRFDEETGAFANFCVGNGDLPSDFCYNLSQTNQGNLIILTDKGVTLFHPGKGAIESINLGYKGLLISATHSNCGLLACKDGEIFIGGIDGLSSFYEEDLQKKNIPYNIYFSELYIANKQVIPGDKKSILTEVLPRTQAITLTHRQNNLMFNFASNNYVGILSNAAYEYTLEGFDHDWVQTGNKSIYYANLNPGKYVLKVREKYLRQKPLPQEIQLTITIERPYYATPLAYLLYVLITVSIISAFIYFRYSKLKLVASLEVEKKEKEHIEVLNQAKLHFFTNISHEFKTPLTLIISQIEMLLQSTSLSPFIYNKILKVYRQAHHMLSLIGELLDFRKFEQHRVVLNVSEQNLISFLKEIYFSFYEYSLSYGIDYKFSSEHKDLFCTFDAKQLRKVFYNLLSNAFKYTSRGYIEMNIREEEECICIKIIDSGKGIEKKDIDKVFDMFYQGAGMDDKNGTGIGLALTKSIVEAHHGTIAVESRPEYGSIFIVHLKKGDKHFKEDNPAVVRHGEQTNNIQPDTMPEPFLIKGTDEAEKTPPPVSTTNEKLPLMLIVEDNEELLQVLSTIFSPMYDIILARDGAEGLQKAVNKKPDLILSDVMMPVMSGTEMCLRIKSNLDTCHIPVVLLTALNSNEQNMEGLQRGADDYISKPFNAKLLLARCNNLIRNRQLSQKKYHSQEEFNIRNIATNQLDRNFMDKVEEIINRHLDDPEFDVNRLAKEMALGRSTLFTKFKGLTGLTPNEFILNYKLKRASALLRTRPDLQIVEISDLFGFSSSRYFSKCFKEQFSISPLDYRKNQERNA
jgi:signal transduction histidine kinase/DNA-binding response OmpR family regulator/ligand-binding sensor domain-containing protein